MRSGPSIALALALACAHRSPALTALEPLCGAWRSDDGMVVQERWRFTGDSLAGDSTTGDPNGKIVAWETMTLTAGPRGTVYHAEPSGGTPTEFTEVTDPAVVPAPGEAVWVWTNPAHDFPRRIVYRVAGDRLTATVSDPDGDAEARRGRTWNYRRVTACEAP